MAIFNKKKLALLCWQAQKKTGTAAVTVTKPDVNIKT